MLVHMSLWVLLSCLCYQLRKMLFQNLGSKLMHASLPVAAELALLYFITIKQVNVAMFPIPSLCIKGFGKESLPPL